MGIASFPQDPGGYLPSSDAGGGLAANLAGMADPDLEKPQFFQFLLEWLERLPHLDGKATGHFLEFQGQPLGLGLQLVYLRTPFCGQGLGNPSGFFLLFKPSFPLVDLLGHGRIGVSDLVVQHFDFLP